MNDKVKAFVDNVCTEHKLSKLKHEHADLGVMLGTIFRDMFTDNSYKLPKGVSRLEANAAVINRVKEWYMQHSTQNYS